MSNGIGLLAETSLHAALKLRYSQPSDQIEALVDGYVIDIVRGEELIEVQTSNFTALRRKLARLLDRHPVRVIYPISQEKWIVKQGQDGRVIARRKSPRRGQLTHLFLELVRIPRLLEHPNFTLEVILIREEEIQVNDGKGSWRRKGWSIADRMLLDVVAVAEFREPADLAVLLPPGLPDHFTTRDLARLLGQHRYLAQKMAYCLRELELIEPVGKRGRSYLYVEVPHEKVTS